MKKNKKEGKKMDVSAEDKSQQKPIFDDSKRSDFFKRRQRPVFQAAKFTPEDEAKKIGKIFSKMADVKSVNQGQ